MRPRLLSFELAWADAAFDAIFPSGSALAHGIAPMKPAAFFDDVVATVPIEPSLGLRVTLWIIALAPLFTIRRLATIASLDPESRQRVLDRLLNSRVYAVRQLVAGFKAMGSLLYAQSPAIRSQMSTPSKEHEAPLAATSLVRVRASAKGGVDSHDNAAE